MAEKGVVVELNGELAVIKMMRSEACAKCRACVAGMSEKEMSIVAENACGAQVGDWVEMELRENGFYKAVLIMYGIPLIGLVSGILAGYFLLAPALSLGGQNAADLLSFATGIVCMGLSYLWIHSKEHIWSGKKYRPVAARVSSADEK